MSFQDNFTIDAGATFVREYIYKDSDGAVIDLTGYLARAQVRRSTFGAVILESVPVIDPDTYVITMSWTATQTLNLRDSNYVYGLMVYNDTTEDVGMVARGVIMVNQSIVR